MPKYLQCVYPPWTEDQRNTEKNESSANKLKFEKLSFPLAAFFGQLVRDYFLPYREVIRYLLNVSFGKMMNYITNTIILSLMLSLSIGNNFHPSKLYSRFSHNIFPLHVCTINETQSEKYGLTYCAVGGCHGDFKIQVYISE